MKIQDLDGADKGLFNTGTATIIVADINDHPPTFTKASVSDEHTPAEARRFCFPAIECVCAELVTFLLLSTKSA